ncbi:MAG: hypothetical protein QOE11_2132 [Solirubrobacteraceae bacterium]|nr:hypothetical protein [Solirubrobacteraceae bacterium]
MDLLAAWLLYPAALALLCLGLGLLVERAAGWRLPGALLLPTGLCALLVLARLLTAQRATAPYALAAVGLLAAAGLIAGFARLRALRPDPWMSLAAIGVYLVFAAPILVSGAPSIAGYLALPDTGHQLALAQLYADRGPDWQSLHQGSTYEGVAPYILGHYPVGAQALLGVTAPLGVVDLAWLYQPVLSFMALALCLALGALVGPLLRRRWQTAVVAFGAAQPALVVGFALQGSIKEMATVAVLGCAVALAAAAIRERRPARSLVALAITAAAALSTLGPAGLAFLVVPAVAVLAIWGLRIARERSLRELGSLLLAAALAAVLSLPVLSSLGAQIAVNGATLDAGGLAGPATDLGNLAAPLELQQALGVWLNGDYRYATNQRTLATLQDIALWTVGALALLGLAWAIRRRAWGPLLLAGLAVPSVYLLHRGASYADAKVLMIVSPAILLLALLGATCLWTGWWRPLSLVATAALLAAVGGSAALAYHDVSLAPHDRYEEMLSLEHRLAGRGPVLLNEYDEFAKYFLSAVPAFNDPESDHLYRRRPYHPNAERDPRRRPSVKTPVDMDDLQLAYVERFPYIILRRSPTSSRPPANFRRISIGTYYELWRRTATPRVEAHAPLGRTVRDPAGTVTERTARALAAQARRRGAAIAYVPRSALATFLISHHPRPPRWTGFGDYPEALVTDGPGHIDAPVSIPRSGRYHVWVEGSFSRRLTLEIDGRPVGHTPRVLNNPGAYASIATVRLRRGLRGVQVLQGGGDLLPGNGGYRSSLRHIGPIVFEPVQDEPRRVVRIGPGDWRSLIGARADWLELVAR